MQNIGAMERKICVSSYQRLLVLLFTTACWPRQVRRNIRYGCSRTLRLHFSIQWYHMTHVVFTCLPYRMTSPAMSKACERSGWSERRHKSLKSLPKDGHMYTAIETDL
eukprot:460709-Amphidinium_carterae.1